MRNYTTNEKTNGELAVRTMSEKAQQGYNSTDIGVIEYTDLDATFEAEQKAFDNDVDFFPGELNVVRYAIVNSGSVTENLTYEEAEKYLEDSYEAYRNA